MWLDSVQSILIEMAGKAVTATGLRPGQSAQGVNEGSSNGKRNSVFARDSRDLREKRDGVEVSSSQVAPVTHILLVSLTLHERRITQSITGR